MSLVLARQRDAEKIDEMSGRHLYSYTNGSKRYCDGPSTTVVKFPNICGAVLGLIWSGSRGVSTNSSLTGDTAATLKSRRKSVDHYTGSVTPVQCFAPDLDSSRNQILPELLHFVFRRFGNVTDSGLLLKPSHTYLGGYS